MSNATQQSVTVGMSGEWVAITVTGRTGNKIELQLDPAYARMLAALLTAAADAADLTAEDRQPGSEG